MNNNLALKVLKKVYSQGDDYSASETRDKWKASFSNDYPLQHGTGWSIEIDKNNFTYKVTKKVEKMYGSQIKEAIKNLRL